MFLDHRSARAAARPPAKLMPAPATFWMPAFFVADAEVDAAELAALAALPVAEVEALPLVVEAEVADEAADDAPEAVDDAPEAADEADVAGVLELEETQVTASGTVTP